MKTVLSICPRCKKPHKELSSHAGSYEDRSYFVDRKGAEPQFDVSFCNCNAPVYVVGYREGMLASLVEEYKFKSIRSTGKILAELLDAAIPQLENVVVVPLPTISRHIRERGFDHMKLITRYLAKIRGYRMLPLLERAKNTVQVGANRKTRIRQAKEAFQVKMSLVSQVLEENGPGIHLLVIDDIWTTGASIDSAIKKLQRVGFYNIAAAVVLTGR